MRGPQGGQPSALNHPLLPNVHGPPANGVSKSLQQALQTSKTRLSEQNPLVLCQRMQSSPRGATGSLQCGQKLKSIQHR